MNRERSRAEGERWSWVLRRHDLDLCVVLDDGFDGVVEHAWNGYVHGLLLGHNVAGVAVLNVALKDARGMRRMWCVRCVGSVQIGVMPGGSVIGRGSTCCAGRRSCAVLSKANGRAEAGVGGVRLLGRRVGLEMLMLMEAVGQMSRMDACV